MNRFDRRPESMSLRFVRWFILNVLVFYLGLFLIVFIAARNIPASTSSATLVFSVLLPIAVFSFYKGKIRAVYPFLKTSHVSLCAFCNEKVERGEVHESSMVDPVRIQIASSLRG